MNDWTFIYSVCAVGSTNIFAIAEIVLVSKVHISKWDGFTLEVVHTTIEWKLFPLKIPPFWKSLLKCYPISNVGSLCLTETRNYAFKVKDIFDLESLGG